jgi:RimJ/RimL family protein N-acetyltransferase
VSPRRRKLPDDFLVREATEEDAEELASFACSRGHPCEDEVEAFVWAKALECALDGQHHGYRLLLVREEKRLVASVGYHQVPLGIEDFTRAQVATLIHLLAIGLPDQGRRLDDGSPLADAVLQTAIFDAIEKLGHDVVTAIVAQENLRALAVCERNGLRSQIAYGPGLVRLTGRFQV